MSLKPMPIPPVEFEKLSGALLKNAFAAVFTTDD
jgi:hypothetical protein